MKFRYAMVCSSNQNRSMEAHALLKRQGFDVSSYGTGAHVKLPGPSLREPNVYDFGTPYKQMFDDLRRKDPELYPILPPSFFYTLKPVFACPENFMEKKRKFSFGVLFFLTRFVAWQTNRAFVCMLSYWHRLVQFWGFFFFFEISWKPKKELKWF